MYIVPSHAIDHALCTPTNSMQAPKTHFHREIFMFFIVFVSINGFPSN